ncbi:unnamed protein product [Candida verbasci]|uniref:F-box domain-containing protein n=1 Tax=Candida verbasci TaxID=1227364 RepID=A0A9W4XCA4_9ASCO|nr:unnamed protein product [Candida verbasci]
MLPLDIIIHIIDIGGLNIKDIFSLYQTNKLFRLKLSHPYFWNRVYYILFTKILKHYDIELELIEDYYEACLRMYHDHLSFEIYMDDPNKEKLFYLSDLIEQFVDYRYLPIIYNLYKIEQKELKTEINYIQKQGETIQFTNYMILSNILQAQVINIGIRKLKKLTKVLEPDFNWYEQVWFSIASCQRNSFDLVQNRTSYLNKIRLKYKKYFIERYPQYTNGGHLESFEWYMQFIASQLYHIYRWIDQQWDWSRYIQENYNILYLYSRKRYTSALLIASVAIKILHEVVNFDKLTIEGMGPAPKPSISKYAIVVKDRCFPVIEAAELIFREMSLCQYAELETLMKPLKVTEIPYLLKVVTEELDLSWRKIKNHGFPLRDNTTTYNIIMHGIENNVNLTFREFTPVIEDLAVKEFTTDFSNYGNLVITKRTGQLGIITGKKYYKNSEGNVTSIELFMVKTLDGSNHILRRESFNISIIDHHYIFSFLNTFGFENLYICGFDSFTIFPTRIKFHSFIHNE